MESVIAANSDSRHIIYEKSKIYVINASATICFIHVDVRKRKVDLLSKLFIIRNRNVTVKTSGCNDRNLRAI